ASLSARFVRSRIPHAASGTAGDSRRRRLSIPSAPMADLPLVHAEHLEVHLGATLLSCASTGQLVALAHDPKLSRFLLGRLSPEQRSILEIVQAHGGAIEGPILLAELRARKLLPEPDPKRPWLIEDPVKPLREWLLLCRTESGYDDNYSSSRLAYPTLA